MIEAITEEIFASWSGHFIVFHAIVSEALGIPDFGISRQLMNNCHIHGANIIIEF